MAITQLLSISLQFGTEFDHVTAAIAYIRHVEGQMVKDQVIR